jgi:hypothetical protein
MKRCSKCNSVKVFRLRIDSDYTSSGYYEPVNDDENYTEEELAYDGSDKPDIDLLCCDTCGHMWEEE